MPPPVLWRNRGPLYKAALVILIAASPLNVLSIALPYWLEAEGKAVFGTGRPGTSTTSRVDLHYGIWQLCSKTDCYGVHDVESDVGVGVWLHAVQFFMIVSVFLHLLAVFFGTLQNFLSRNIARQFRANFWKTVVHRDCAFTEDIGFVGGFLGQVATIVFMLCTKEKVSDGASYSWSFALGFMGTSLTVLTTLTLTKAHTIATPRPQRPHGSAGQSSPPSGQQEDPAFAGREQQQQHGAVAFHVVAAPVLNYSQLWAQGGEYAYRGDWAPHPTEQDNSTFRRGADDYYYYTGDTGDRRAVQDATTTTTMREGEMVERTAGRSGEGQRHSLRRRRSPSRSRSRSRSRSDERRASSKAKRLREYGSPAVNHSHLVRSQELENIPAAVAPADPPASSAHATSRQEPGAGHPSSNVQSKAVSSRTVSSLNTTTSPDKTSTRHAAASSAKAESSRAQNSKAAGSSDRRSGNLSSEKAQSSGKNSDPKGQQTSSESAVGLSLNGRMEDRARRGNPRAPSPLSPNCNGAFGMTSPATTRL